MPDMQRRSLIGAMATAAVAPAMAEGAVPDFNAPATNLLGMLKILGSTDPKQVTMSYAMGRVYACIDKQPPIPLFGTHSISAARAQVRPDGTFLLRQHITGFRTTFGTETVIDQMKNPVTGDIVQLPLTDYGIGDSEYAFNGTFSLRAEGKRTQLNALGPRPWVIDNGAVGFSDDSVMPEPGPMHPKIDAVTRYAPIADIADAKVTTATSWFNFSAVDPFRAYLKMRDPGFQLWHVAGRKVFEVSKMPGFIAQVAKERFPKLFDLPAF